MSQWLLRSDTVIYEAATQRPVDELVLTFHLVYRHSSVCQFPARLYLGHLRAPRHWSQRSLTERRSCKHIVNSSGVNGSQVDGRRMGPTNRSCKHSFILVLVFWSSIPCVFCLCTYALLKVHACDGFPHFSGRHPYDPETELRRSIRQVDETRLW